MEPLRTDAVVWVELTSGVHLGQVVQGGAGGSRGLDQVSGQQGHGPNVVLFGRVLLWRQMLVIGLAWDGSGVWDASHRVFDGVVDDQVVVPQREPRSHGDKVSVLQGDGTPPCTEDTARVQRRDTALANANAASSTDRSSSPRRRWPLAWRCRRCRSCWCPTCCGSWCHGGRRTASPHSRPCRQSSSGTQRRATAQTSTEDRPLTSLHPRHSFSRNNGPVGRRWGVGRACQCQPAAGVDPPPPQRSG